MSSVIINKFHESQFGDLTTLRSENTGKTMFIAKEVAALWGHSNSRQAIKDAKLQTDEILIVRKKDSPQFFDQLCKSNLLSSRAPSVQLVTESGLWKMALKSEKPEADKMKDWISRDILPSIRQTGSYTLNNPLQNIDSHRDVTFQKENSKNVNKKNYENGGVINVINYNRTSCLLHVGMRPNKVRQFGKSMGLKSTDCSSAKQVLRKINPSMACCMSLTDQMVKEGYPLEKSAEISTKFAQPLFKALLELGGRPAELSR